MKKSSLALSLGFISILGSASASIAGEILNQKPVKLDTCFVASSEVDQNSTLIKALPEKVCIHSVVAIPVNKERTKYQVYIQKESGGKFVASESDVVLGRLHVSLVKSSKFNGWSYRFEDVSFNFSIEGSDRDAQSSDWLTLPAVTLKVIDSNECSQEVQTDYGAACIQLYDYNRI